MSDKVKKFEDTFGDLLGGDSGKSENKKPKSSNVQVVQDVQQEKKKGGSSKRPSTKKSSAKSKEHVWKEPSHLYGKTQGRKGSAVLRINMGFTEDNHEYLKEESRKRGLSITDFVNAVLTEYRESPDGYIFGK